MKLSMLAMALGAVGSAVQLFAIAKPAQFARAARAFPRSVRWGYVLMAAGTIWFLWNLNNETISDFAPYKKLMLVGFGLVGVLACLYVPDYLAVRGLAVVTLLFCKTLLDTARWDESPWCLVISALAYVWILGAMWFVISPWRMRDAIAWMTATERRIRWTSALRLGVFALVFILGLTQF